MLLLISINSVARGQGRGCNPPSPPHRHTEYAKQHVFITFENDFCTKNENSPFPHWHWQWECVYFDSGLEKNSVTKVDPRLGEDLFFFFFFFCWSSPYFARKTGPNPNEDLFIGLQLSDAKPFQFQLKTVLVWFYTSKTDPSLQIPGYATDLNT